MSTQPRRYLTADEQRAKDLRQIHCLRREAGLSDAEYREIVASLSEGVESSAHLSGGGRRKLIARLRALSPTRNPIADKDRPASYGAKPQLAKINALLVAAGRKWAYARAIYRRSIDAQQRLEFATPEQLGKLIAMLSIDARRHGR